MKKLLFKMIIILLVIITGFCGYYGYLGHLGAFLSGNSIKRAIKFTKIKSKNNLYLKESIN